VTEKQTSVTENERDVTQESVTVSRAHALYEGMSRLSRVTDNTVTVTDERDSDSHSPSVRDRHGHPDAGASENLPWRRTMVTGETYCASCDRCGEPFQLCECGMTAEQRAQAREQRLRIWRRLGLVVIAFWTFVAWCIWGIA